MSDRAPYPENGARELLRRATATVDDVKARDAKTGAAAALLNQFVELAAAYGYETERSEDRETGEHWYVKPQNDRWERVGLRLWVDDKGRVGSNVPGVRTDVRVESNLVYDRAEERWYGPPIDDLRYEEATRQTHVSALEELARAVLEALAKLNPNR